MFPRKLIVALFLLPFLGVAARADFESGLRDYEDQNYPAALAEFQSLANAGDPDAQAILALMYLEGHAVQEDMATAIDWYVRAAEQGQAEAQYALALISIDGLAGAARDLTTAAMWMHEAARRGHMYAQFDMGHMYAEGAGVEASDENAATWFEFAAEQGHRDAQFNLGIMYMTGRGVEGDRTSAFNWFRQAAEQGHADAQYNMGISYLTGNTTPRNPVQGQRWFQSAAAQDHASAMVALGLLKQDGDDGISQDSTEAARLFRQAADLGSPEGQYFLAVMYTRGTGVEQDPVEAYAWLELSDAQAREGTELAEKVETLRQALTAVMTASEISQATAIARQRSLTPRTD